MEGTASGAYKEARGWERDSLSGGIIREEIIGPIKAEEGVKFQSRVIASFWRMLWYRNLNSEA